MNPTAPAQPEPAPHNGGVSQPPQSPLRRLTLAAGGLLLGSLTLAAAFGTTADAIARSPFVWLDAAVVSLIFAVPFAVVCAERLRFVAPQMVIVAVSLGLLTAIVCFVQSDLSAELLGWGRDAIWKLAVIRFVLSLAAVLGGAIFTSGLLPSEPALWSGDRNTARVFVTGLILLTVAIAVPETYVDSRCRREQERMQELTGSSRYGDALRIARSLRVLQPAGIIPAGTREVSIAEYVRLLEETVEQLESQLAQLSGLDDAESRIDRARLEAQLARPERAIAELLPVADSASPAPRIHALLLLGTIHENGEQWEQGLARYEQALELIARTGAIRDPQLTAAALKGIAYTSRKLGRSAAATAAYEELIAFAPTAENHFLLAQFYEDAQQAGPAQSHARKAMLLAPSRFQDSGGKLIDRVKTSHFGCFNAYLDE